jgi:hypothetical protein
VQPTGSDAWTALRAALAVASPAAIVALIALPAAVLDLPGPVTGLPLGLLLVVLVQLVGLLIAREGELWNWFRVWLVLLACTLTLLPTLAIQAASARVPYTTWSNGSAGLLVVATLGSLAALLGLMLMAAALAADAPEHASILLTPALTLVPAVLGVPGDLGERSALLALAEAWGVAAVAITIGWLLPKRWQPMVGLATVGIQFVALWLLGFGPGTAPGQGIIVPFLAILILAATVLAAAVVPIVALIFNRFALTVRSQPREKAPARSGPISRSDLPSAERRSPRSAPRRGH